MVNPRRLRSLIRAKPFRRFTLVTKDGARIDVKRPFGIGMDIGGKIVVLPDPPEGLSATLPISSLRDLIVEPPPSKKTLQTLERIRQMRSSSPFVPFQLTIDDGRKFVVDRSFRIAIAPSGRELCYAVSATDFQWFPPSRVRQVTRVPG